MKLIGSKFCRRRYRAQVKVKRFFWKKVMGFIKKKQKKDINA